MRRTLLILVLLAIGSAPACALAPVSRDAAPSPVSERPATEPARRWIGYYVPSVPTETAPLAALERATGRAAAVSHYFLGVAVEPFAPVKARNASAHGAQPMITLEFWDFRKATASQPEFSLERIAAGAHDAYLRRFARDAAAFGEPLLLRPLHEMNGTWYPWGGTVNGNTPSQFVAAWRHVHDIFAEEGASNVRFVWCPNAQSVPDVEANAIAAYWPGDEYVDFVALDGYNRGGEEWRSFDAVFSGGYAALGRLTQRPVIITEVACAQDGGDKAAWIRSMFDSLDREYRRVIGVVWFNADKERDWRIESSAHTLRAFKEGSAEWVDAAK